MVNSVDLIFLVVATKVNSVFQNHKVKITPAFVKKSETSHLHRKIFSCGLISNQKILININYAVRMHIKLITASKSDLFLEQNQSTVLHLSNVF